MAGSEKTAPKTTGLDTEYEGAKLSCQNRASRMVEMAVLILVRVG